MPQSGDLRKFAELASELYIVLDHHGVIHSVNSVWETLLGYTTEEMINQSFVRFLHPDDIEASAEVMARLYEGRSNHQFHNRYRTRAGEDRWIRWRATMSNGCVYGVGHDMTSEREATLKLEESNRLLSNALRLEREWRATAELQQERFRDLFNQAPMIAAVYSGPNHTIELANPSFYALVNFRNVMGRSIHEALPSIDETTGRTLKRVFETGKRFVGRNFPMRADWTADGAITEKQFHLIFEPILNNAGTVEAIWYLAFDVTETVELEAKLRSAERMSSLGEMAAGIGHEINNPLAYSLLNLDLLSDKLHCHFGSRERFPAPLSDHLRKSIDGLDRVRDIVKGLKAFSRHDESSLEPIDVAEPLRSAVDFTANETRHRAKVLIDFRPVPRVVANAGRLAQVFTNLLVNAAQALDLGKANENAIRIRLYANEQDKVIVEVEDTGCGIPQDQLGRVFEPFFTSKPVGVGTGLGLSICHGIVTSFGGDIQIESELGRGTRVRIVLPGTEAGVCAPPVVTAPLRINGERKRILVIDDDKALRDVLVTALESDHDVVAIDSAVDALEHLDRVTSVYDWIICDVMMPAMTGMEFYETIRAQGRGFEKKIILMTGGAFTPKVRNWMEALTNPKLQKPFRIRQLKELLENSV